MAFTQLNPCIPVSVLEKKGKGTAIAVIDYGQNTI